MKMKNNYKVSGKKMTSRFGWSHKACRLMAKNIGGGPAPHYTLSKRLAKKCTHKRWVDDGYGGHDGGCAAGHCKDCGYSYHHTLY